MSTRDALIAWAIGGGLLGALLACRPLKRWFRKVRRRKPGIYLVRTTRPTGNGRHNGYVGESVNVHMRRNDHMGWGRYEHAPKPWSDLDPRWYIFPLPWWLGWKWVLKSLETLAILVLAPVYNDQKNHWNPRRIPLSVAKIQRLHRNQRRETRIHHGWIR